MHPAKFKNSNKYSSHFLNTHSPQAQLCSKLLKCINSFNLHTKDGVIRGTHYVLRGAGIVYPESTAVTGRSSEAKGTVFPNLIPLPGGVG